MPIYDTMYAAIFTGTTIPQYEALEKERKKKPWNYDSHSCPKILKQLAYEVLSNHEDRHSFVVIHRV
jgi:hypothetical protein